MAGKTRNEIAAVYLDATQNNIGPITVSRDDLGIVIGEGNVEGMNIDEADTTGGMVLVDGAVLREACGGAAAPATTPVVVKVEPDDGDEE
jgi:hypothetical protein